MITTDNDYRKYLLEADRNYRGQSTWQNIFGSIDIAGNKSLSATNYNYSQAMNDAYQQSHAAKQSILSSNLIANDKQRLIDSNSAALEQAFTSFANQQSQAQQDVRNNMAASVAAYQEELDKRAENFEKFDRLHYDYLAKIYENNPQLFTDDKAGIWSRYLTPETDAETGEIIVDDDGNTINRLMTREELTHQILRDEHDYLTIKGIDFYDQMENWAATRGDGKIQSFDEYLLETDSELRDWATSIDAYNYTEAGTNVGSFKTAYGMTSTDFKYEFIERFGGLSESEITDKFKKFEDFATEYQNKIKTTKNGYAIENEAQFVIDTTKQLRELTDSMEITDDIEKALGVSFDTFIDNMVKYQSGMKNTLELAGDYFAQLGIGVTSGTLAGASIGAIAGGTVGTAVPVPLLGTAAGTGIGAQLGGSVGAIVGAIGGAISGFLEVSSGRKSNEALEQQLSDIYLKMVTQLVDYVKNTHKNVNSKF